MTGTFRRHAVVVALTLHGFGVACASGGDDSALYSPPGPTSGPVTGTCTPACVDPTPVCCDRDDGNGLSCHISPQYCRCEPNRTDGPCEGNFPSCCDNGDGRGYVCRSSLQCL